MRPLARSFATRFYDSPLYKNLKSEYESVTESQEAGLIGNFGLV